MAQLCLSKPAVKSVYIKEKELNFKLCTVFIQQDCNFYVIFYTEDEFAV